jgi:DNA-directed RNA polymerase subunit RPC12/RpoP
MTTWNTSHTDEVVCPYCGHKHRDSYEFFENGQECAEIACGHCEREFAISQHVSIAYSSRKPQPERGPA